MGWRSASLLPRVGSKIGVVISLSFSINGCVRHYDYELLAS